MSHLNHAEAVSDGGQTSSELRIHLDSLYDKRKYEELLAELAAVEKVARKIAADFNNLGAVHSRRGRG